MASETKSKSKNKNKSVNKVKIFLANPSKPKCPSLEDEEVHQLQSLLIEIIDKSRQLPRSFATTAHICLGLQSSLRAINNGKAGCVLVSASVKPRYLLGLLARNVEVKDETVPTYIQAQLEDVTQKIFGVKTLALVLPKDTTHLGDELAKWIEAHRKPKKIKAVNTLYATKTTKKVTKIDCVVKTPREQLKTLTVGSKPVEKAEVKPWGSGYISFSKDSTAMDIDEVNPEEDENKLLGALDELAKKAKQQIKRPGVSYEPPARRDLMDNPMENESATVDEDDFLGNYAPLTVHKICPNPDRKPRKKRKKNANKQKNKK